ncbi:Neurotransmitter-gated ion-channel ligand binding domain [Globodera pallida]|nr:Neurotransmitter-gated ion-channel ligand binding domain [Globodera pallida]
MLIRVILLLLPVVTTSDDIRQLRFEKTGREIRLATEMHAWGYQHLQEEIASSSAIDDIRIRSNALRTGRRREKGAKEGKGNEQLQKNVSNPMPPEQRHVGMTAHARLIEDLVNRRYYESTVHPRRNYLQPTRVNVSMSLYQLLEVDERSQTITANVWMVQDWYDECTAPTNLAHPISAVNSLNSDYELLNRTIVPYENIWIPDTVLYNSAQMDRKNSEAVMNAIVETGHWRNDGQGAAVQLMFPAIYKLSCKMNVRFFPYDQQNCSFIISSWTHDMATIDYHFARPTVNMKNYVVDDEWDVISFEFSRQELQFKCCVRPWAMLYAHLVIRRKPLYYIVNLVIPTSIITVVAVIGFFTPSSSTSERDEKLYLGINTLLTMSLMLLMVTNQMPNTSNYVPLMGWYYMGIIFVIVFGTILATIVLFIHARKSHLQPLPHSLLKATFVLVQPWFRKLVLEPPANLFELWTEYGLLKPPEQKGEEVGGDGDGAVQRKEPCCHPLLRLCRLFAISRHPFEKALRHEREMAERTRKAAEEASKAVGRERRRRETIVEAADFLAQFIGSVRPAQDRTAPAAAANAPVTALRVGQRGQLAAGEAAKTDEEMRSRMGVFGQLAGPPVSVSIFAGHRLFLLPVGLLRQNVLLHLTFPRSFHIKPPPLSPFCHLPSLCVVLTSDRNSRTDQDLIENLEKILLRFTRDSIENLDRSDHWC